MAYPELVKIEGSIRETSRKANKGLRKNSKVPAVLYGPEIKENVHFAIDELELERILKRPQTKLQELTVDGKVYKTLLKKVEFDPVNDRPIHADFYVLSPNHKVNLRVPLRLVGVSIGVRERGGRIFQPMHYLRIRVLPEYIPSEFEVDISALDVLQSLHVRDLTLENIVSLDSLDRTIVTIRPPKGASFDELLAEEAAEETATEETETEASSEAPEETSAE